MSNVKCSVCGTTCDASFSVCGTCGSDLAPAGVPSSGMTEQAATQGFIQTSFTQAKGESSGFGFPQQTPKGYDPFGSSGFGATEPIQSSGFGTVKPTPAVGFGAPTTVFPAGFGTAAATPPSGFDTANPTQPVGLGSPESPPPSGFDEPVKQTAQTPFTGATSAEKRFAQTINEALSDENPHGWSFKECFVFFLKLLIPFYGLYILFSCLVGDPRKYPVMVTNFMRANLLISLIMVLLCIAGVSVVGVIAENIPGSLF